MSSTRRNCCVDGCNLPMWILRPGRVTSNESSSRDFANAAALTASARSVKADSSATLTRFAADPTTGRSSFESFPNSAKTCINGELRPTFATRQASSAAWSVIAFKDSNAVFSISFNFSNIQASVYRYWIFVDRRSNIQYRLPKKQKPPVHKMGREALKHLAVPPTLTAL